MRVIIKNSKNETAVIYKINAVTFDPKEFESLNVEELSKNYRRYLFIDDKEDSLNSNVIEKFEILFEKFGLNCKKFNNGKVFPIDYITNEKALDLDMEFEPRHGQDGGVVGVCYS